MIIEKRKFIIPEFLLQSGPRLRNVEIGFETYGRLNETGTNAILVTHYFSGSSHAAGKFSDADVEPGYWDSIIGPGKAIDTDRFFVVSSDVISNMTPKLAHVVTTGPRSIDPETGKPYGASFPDVTIADFVEAQKLLCDSLGIRKLHAVAGPSMGALQAYEWAARFPDFVDRVVAVIGAGLHAEPYLHSMVETWRAMIELDRDFDGGNYIGNKEPDHGMAETLKLITVTALHPQYARRLFSHRPGAFDRALNDLTKERAKICDANSLVRLVRAVQSFDVRDRVDRMKAKFLVLPVTTDVMMHPEFAVRGADRLREAGLSVELHMIETDGGHLDGLSQVWKAADHIRRFLG